LHAYNLHIIVKIIIQVLREMVSGRWERCQYGRQSVYVLRKVAVNMILKALDFTNQALQ
jgi:hypothetical protein